MRHAWITRPDTVRIADETGKTLFHRRADRPFDGTRVRTGNGPWRACPGIWPSQASPPCVDTDGLVISRPSDSDIDYGHGTFYENYYWVAMLDPAEIAGSVWGNSDGHDRPGVDLTDISTMNHHGRLAWQATAQPTPHYEPRCACCALLDTGHTTADQDTTEPDTRFIIRLDETTGMCVYVARQALTSRPLLDVTITTSG